MNDTFEEFLNTFYGPTAQWFSIIVYIMATLVLISNTILILIILTSKTLRIKSSNWFIVAFALSGFLHGVGHMLVGSAIRFGSVDNRLLCSIAGGIAVFTGASSFGFPFLIAADRYYKVTIPQPNKFSLGHTLFTDAFSIPLILAWFFFVLLGNIPQLLNNTFGEDIIGTCGARKFSKVRILVMYFLSVIGIFFFAILLAYIYYVRLTKWIKETQRTSSAENRKRTLEIMLMMRLIILIPATLNSIPLLLTLGQMILPELPMWLKRSTTIPYYLSNVVDPWLTIFLVQPIRYRALQLLGRSKAKATVSVVGALNMNVGGKRPAQSVNHLSRIALNAQI